MITTKAETCEIQTQLLKLYLALLQSSAANMTANDSEAVKERVPIYGVPEHIYMAHSLDNLRIQGFHLKVLMDLRKDQSIWLRLVISLKNLLMKCLIYVISPYYRATYEFNYHNL